MILGKWVIIEHLFCFRVHRQLVKLFARGLENIDTPSEKSDGTRSNCCKSSEKAD